MLGPAEIAAEIGRDLGFLQTDMADVPTRQRNLRAVFLHTWSRLSAAARQVFMRLSVFRGGASAEAVRHVTGATLDTLAELVDMALLRYLPNGRFEIHELLRQFAAEQLAGIAEEDDQQVAGRQHSHYYLRLLANQEPVLQGSQQRNALDIIQADFENISVAWRWAVRQHAFALLGPALQPLFLYCDVRGTYRAGMIHFAAAATELEPELAASAEAGQVLRVLWGRLTVRLGACEVLLANYGRGEQLLLDSLPHIDEATERAYALLYLGQAAAERGDLALAHARIIESLEISRQYRDFASMSQATHALQVGKSMAEAYQLGTESLTLARKAGRPDLIAIRLTNLGWHTWGLGNYALANTYWREGIDLCDQLGLRGENAWPLDCLGFAAWCQGDMAAAERYIEAALAIYAEVGRQAHVGMCMAELALVLASTGRVEQAIALAQQAVTATRQLDGGLMLIISLNCWGAVLLAAGKLEEARRTLREAVQRAWSHQVLPGLTVALYYFAELLILENHSTKLPGATERAGLTVTLLSCVRTHEATWQAFRDKAAQLQASIECALPAATVRAAIQTGSRQTIGQIVETLLGVHREEITDAPQQASANGSSAQGADSVRVLFEPLTARELTVLRLIAVGRSNQDIAAELVITQGTAKWYVSQILGKLGVQSRTQAVARGQELGLLA